MPESLANRSVLMLVADDYEDLELWYPLLRVREAGATAVVAGPETRTLYRGKHGYPCESEAAIRDVAARDFDGVMIPGGWMPDKLRRDPATLALVRALAESGKLVASICHGPWIMISAGVCRGVRMTSTPAIRDDLLNAGATWVDEPVVVDRHFISSRRPPDLPVFAARIIDHLASRH
ncbi:MAG: putative cysteine protease YraA [Phycisphaerae bacterium]|nr:putative cysteine protease YraA [Phycisphaerae bacterium]